MAFNFQIFERRSDLSYVQGDNCCSNVLYNWRETFPFRIIRRALGYRIMEIGL
jgi:hypothetical protein